VNRDIPTAPTTTIAGMPTAITATVAVALILVAAIGYELMRVADQQSTANCIAAAEARYPVVLTNPQEAAGQQGQLSNYGERQDAVDACDPPTD
jgi:hypothetical protein